jgi:hypothetical protein
MLLVQLILMCLNETFSKFHVRQDLKHFLFRIVWSKMSHRRCFSSVILKNVDTLLDISKEIGLELSKVK